MSEGKFLRELHVTDKIIEGIFLVIFLKLLQMTQTQEIITLRLLKMYEWM